MTRRVAWLAAWLAAGLVACGDGGGSTEFGAYDDVLAYRTALSPLVEETSAIEAEITERAVGPDSVAIDSHLVPVYQEVRPRLAAVQVALASIRPPRRLRDLHAQIRQMVQLRLDAYQIVIDGFAAGDPSVYADAVERLRQANALIPEINDQLLAVDLALAGRDDRVLAARPATLRPVG